MFPCAGGAGTGMLGDAGLPPGAAGAGAAWKPAGGPPGAANGSRAAKGSRAGWFTCGCDPRAGCGGTLGSAWRALRPFASDSRALFDVVIGSLTSRIVGEPPSSWEASGSNDFRKRGVVESGVVFVVASGEQLDGSIGRAHDRDA